MYIEVQPPPLPPQPNVKENKLNKKQSPCWHKTKGLLLSILHYNKLYLETCVAHCYVYLVKNGLTLLERIFWFILMAVCHYFCIFISMQSVMRFMNKNSYVGIERNYFDWNTTLPSVTICPMERLNRHKFDDFCT